MELSETYLRAPLVVFLVLALYAYLFADFYHKIPHGGGAPLVTTYGNSPSSLNANATDALNIAAQQAAPYSAAPSRGSCRSPQQRAKTAEAKVVSKQEPTNAVVANTNKSDNIAPTRQGGEPSKLSHVFLKDFTTPNNSSLGEASAIPNNISAIDGKWAAEASKAPTVSFHNNSAERSGSNISLVNNIRLTNGSMNEKSNLSVSQRCNIYHGKWVRDDWYPLYKPASCPFVDTSFRCQENGRRDSLYTKWRWQPFDCDIPRMNATDLLERLRDKRLLIVGDSLARNQFESLICILHGSLDNKSRFLETNKDGYTTFNFLDSNSSIQYCRSNFLVEDAEDTLRLDKIDRYHKDWGNAHVIIFNTGHWWTHTKTKTGQNYFQEGGHVYPELNVLVAYRKALETWARWVDQHVNPAQTQVYFRGYSPSHFWGGQWNSGGQCHEEVEPIFNDTYITGSFDGYPDKLKIVEETLQHMETPVVLLDVTRLSDYRKDAHPSIYRFQNPKTEEFQDCSHWCLPGLPDIWNELMYASLWRSKLSVRNRK